MLQLHNQYILDTMSTYQYYLEVAIVSLHIVNLGQLGST